MIKSEEISNPTSCLNKAEDDEPVFVLRAKDLVAAPTVAVWIALAELYGLHGDKLDEARGWLSLALDWRHEHGLEG